MRFAFDMNMRDGYEKAAMFVSFAITCILLTVFTGCATRSSTGAGELILDYQRQVTTLENRLALYESTVGSAISELGAIREQSGGIEGTVDELIYLFGEYQRGVDNLLRQYRAITEASVSEEQGSADTRDSLRDNDFVEDSGVYIIREGD